MTYAFRQIDGATMYNIFEKNAKLGITRLSLFLLKLSLTLWHPIALICFLLGNVYAQRVECEEPCEGRLSHTVLWEGEGETPSLYSTLILYSWFPPLNAASRWYLCFFALNVIFFHLWSKTFQKWSAIQNISLTLSSAITAKYLSFIVIINNKVTKNFR